MTGTRALCRTAAQARTIDRFWHNRTITGADGIDRSWSEVAIQSLTISMSAYRIFILDSGQSQVSDKADLQSYPIGSKPST